ncbi:sensor histidine kinase [Oceanobacillus neutriphilus]|uniref:Histidine kinase n=1 Tax=Oceanobacillus neutriphilus TaxID=531815 RepID=A0ABQ2NUN6_9BACI|nr:GHKL domain-containing protein [Oceanobacillus neutriphilus]GGP10988.1 histidine kinase [Oceanobacillus neutriphilus]
MFVYDVIAIILIGISHVIFYFELIRYNRLPYIMVITLSFIFTILLGVVVAVTGYPEFNVIMLLLFLLCLGLMQVKLTFMQNLYFALVSMVSITLVKIVLIEFVMHLFMWTSFNIYTWTVSIVHLIISIIILITLGMLRNKVQKLAQFIIKSPIYYISYPMLAAGLIAALILTTPATELLAALHKPYGQMGYSALFILFFILLIIVIIGSHLTKERMLKEQQNHLDNELLDHLAKLEVMHDDLAAFRHDYMNILLTLDEGVRTRNLAQIEHIYHEIIAPTSELINNRNLDIAKLSHIKVPGVKSVLGVKLISAQQQNIQVMIDIPQQIKGIAIPVVDFIRIISILLDNGIEEAMQSKEKILQIAFFELDERQYFIVSNSYKQQMIDLENLYEKHYSTKDGDRGYGLYSLKLMVDKTSNATLETLKTPYFTQTLILKKQ